MPTRSEIISADDPFRDSVAQAESGEFLGDASVLGSILKQLVSAALEAETDESVVEATAEFARRMLGKDPTFVAVPGWNRPGSIDKFVAKYVGSSETDPEEILKHFAAAFLDEATEVVAAAASEDPSEWRWQLDALVLDYSRLLMGVPPSVDTGAEVPAVDPNQALQERLLKMTSDWVEDL